VLEIALGDATSAVVINTAKLGISRESQIFVDGDPAKVIFNVTGKGSVPIGDTSEVEPAILAPLATIRAGKDAVTGSLLAKGVSLKGASTVPSTDGGGGPTGLCCQLVDKTTGKPTTCDDIRRSDASVERCFRGGFPVDGTCNESTGSCEAPSLPPEEVVCCSDSSFGICQAARADDCFLGPQGPAGSVCDAATGACVLPGETSPGDCCDDFFGCSGGPGLGSFFGGCMQGSEVQTNAICDPTSQPFCKSP
jgi:hypothetical protein